MGIIKGIKSTIVRKELTPVIKAVDVKSINTTLHKLLVTKLTPKDMLIIKKEIANLLDKFKKELLK